MTADREAPAEARAELERVHGSLPLVALPALDALVASAVVSVQAPDRRAERLRRLAENYHEAAQAITNTDAWSLMKRDIYSQATGNIRAALVSPLDEADTRPDGEYCRRTGTGTCPVDGCRFCAPADTPESDLAAERSRLMAEQERLLRAGVPIEDLTKLVDPPLPGGGGTP